MLDVLAELPPLAKPLKTLRPSYLDPAEWRMARDRTFLSSPEWKRIRQEIIERDRGCVYCAHQQAGHLEVNHLAGHRDNRPENLETVCVLCHRVLHAGRSAAIYSSLLLFQHAACSQNEIIRLSWHLRATRTMPDRPLMELLGLSGQVPFRMDRDYLAGLYGYVVQRYWLLENHRS